MFYILDLVIHYLSSNSTHGTHSPFVYRLADRVIYQKKDIDVGEDKSAYLIGEIARYLKDEMNMSSVVLDLSQQVSIDNIVQLQNINPVIFINGIYTDDDLKKLWKTLLSDPRIIVTVDLFYFGIVIFRKEQPKENFKLRFPFSKF